MKTVWYLSFEIVKFHSVSTFQEKRSLNENWKKKSAERGESSSDESTDQLHEDGQIVSVDATYDTIEVDGENSAETAKAEFLANLKELGLDFGKAYLRGYRGVRVCND